MKTKKMMLVILINAAIYLVAITSSYGQPRQFRYRVNIENKHLVMKDETKILDKVYLKKGTLIKSEKKYAISDTNYTVFITDTIKRDTTYLTNKTISYVQTLAGEATVKIDKDDMSKLYINYWRNPDTTFTIGTKLRIRSNEIENGSKKDKKDTVIVVKRDTILDVTRISYEDYKNYNSDKMLLSKLKVELNLLISNIITYPDKEVSKKINSLNFKIEETKERIDSLKWFDYVPERIYQIGAKGDTSYLYGKKYQSGYYIKLKNREYVSFSFKCFEIGALTIPFKYHFAFTKNSTPVSDLLTTDLNVGFFCGGSFGKIKYIYREHEENEPSKWLLSIGGFLNLSRTEIDSSTTLSATEPLKQKKAIGIISPGIGVFTSIYEFRFGFFLGNDIAVGQFAQKWDYANRLWIGVGLGYNIPTFWNLVK